MVYEKRPAPLPRTFFTGEERGEIQRLARLCNTCEGLDLKLALAPPPSAELGSACGPMNRCRAA